MTLLDHFLKERSARLKAQAYTSAGAPFTLEVSDEQAPLAGGCQIEVNTMEGGYWSQN